MPSQFDRHAKSAWDWGRQGGRKQQRAAAASDDPLRASAPGKKDPKWCKRNPLGVHEPEIVRSQVRYASSGCGWHILWDRRNLEYRPEWMCFHEECCRHCGKKMRGKLDHEECPDWNPEVPQHVTDKARRYTDESRARRAARRPRITGPSHYRKPKGQLA